jgi:phage-related protein
MPSVDLMTYKQKIELDDSGFNSGMTKAQGNFDKFKSGLGTVGGVLGKTIGAGVTVAGGALVAFGKKGIETASDLNEVQNIVNTTFGGNASKINNWAKSAATSFGMSELSAKQYNGIMGSMLKSMGLTGNQVSDMSTKMVGLAGDMASFYNLDPSEAFEKIRSGISGETEPLKQLGINMSVANLNAFAMSQGLGKTYDSMTQSEQATLRYNYLLNASKDAQGDFSKTSGSLANQMRIAQLKVTDLAGAFGQSLLPMANQALGGILSFVNQSQSAFTNLFTGFSGLLMGTKGAEEQFTSGATTLINSLVTEVVNITPKILTVVTALLPAVTTALMSNLPTLITAVMDIFPQISSTLLSMLPMILNCGVQVILSLVTGLASALPQLIPQIINTVITMASTLLANVDKIVNAGLNLLMGLAQGLITALPQLIAKAPIIIQNLVTAITNNLPKIVEVGIQLIIALAGALIKSIPQLIVAIPQIIAAIVNGFANYYGQMANVGLNMIKGIWNGISNAASWLWSKVSGFCDDLVNRIKRKLGIHSPSTVFAELGDYMAQGLGIGFTSQMTNVSRQMQKAIPTSFDFDISSNINRQFSGLKSNLQMQSSSGYAVASSPINLNVEMGDITVQGNADEKVLAKIQQAQKNATDEAVKQFKQTFTGMDLAGLQRSYV